jgi:hypothetical protein
MQQNCHEFIAYENLVGTRGGRSAGRGAKPSAGTSPITKALPLIRRALKVLSDREVTPQLGLLKSTLLQLDSTFSEREYGAGSFRDFMEKVAAAGAVTLREAGRSMLVESREDSDRSASTPGPPTRKPARWGGAVAPSAPADAVTPAAASIDADVEETMPASPMTMQDGIRAVLQALGGSATPPRWPMYVRQAKQFLRTAIDGFDEKHYGFASLVDLLRAAGKEGVLRVERDRQGAVRIFAGPKLAGSRGPVTVEEPIVGRGVETVAESADGERLAAEPVGDPPIVDAETVEDADGNVAPSGDRQKRGSRRRRTARPKTAGDATKTTKPRTPRARKTARTKAEAADSD